MKRKIKIINLPLFISCFDWLDKIELSCFSDEDGDKYVWVTVNLFNGFDEDKYDSERSKC